MDLFKMYDVRIGDKFYHNNACVKKGASLPDYLIITGLDSDKFFLKAKYENHSIMTKERVFSSDIIRDSNLNPFETNPQWIFVNRNWDKERM